MTDWSRRDFLGKPATFATVAIFLEKAGYSAPTDSIAGWSLNVTDRGAGPDMRFLDCRH
jgi:hypothetical protein